MKYLIRPIAKFVRGYCLVCGTNCDNRCQDQCLIREL